MSARSQQGPGQSPGRSANEGTLTLAWENVVASVTFAVK